MGKCIWGHPEDANGYRLKKGDMVRMDGRPWMVDGPGERYGTFVALNLRTGESVEAKGYDCEHMPNGKIVDNVKVVGKGERNGRLI